MIEPMRHWFRLLAAGCLAAQLLAADDGFTTPAPPAQAPVNLNHPPRVFFCRPLRGWTVWIEQQIAEQDPVLLTNVVRRLDAKLGELLRILPPHTHPVLRQVRLFVLLGPQSHGGGRDNGLEYFQRRAPEFSADLDPRMGSGIVIYSAANFVWLSDLWARKALVHEFAHAWQLEQWPEDEPRILGAWRNAQQRDLYRSVRNDDGGLTADAYARVNQLEYFAELSCMYFVGCNYAPFNRAEFAAYDPDGWGMVKLVWGIGPAPRKRHRP